MASPDIMPFESNAGQGAERAKAPRCGRRDPTAGGMGYVRPSQSSISFFAWSLPYRYRAWILPSSCSRFPLTWARSSSVSLPHCSLTLPVILLPIAWDAVPVHGHAPSSRIVALLERYLPSVVPRRGDSCAASLRHAPDERCQGAPIEHPALRSPPTCDHLLQALTPPLVCPAIGDLCRELLLQVPLEFHQIVGERHAVSSQFRELQPDLLIKFMHIMWCRLHLAEEQSKFRFLVFESHCLFLSRRAHQSRGSARSPLIPGEGCSHRPVERRRWQNVAGNANPW